MANDKKKTLLEMTADELDIELKRTQLEHAKFELEDLQDRVAKSRAKRADIERSHRAMQQSLDDANRHIVAQQDICTHRKGGKNLEGIVKGNDANYAVIFHTYPWGETRVMCTRCCKEWAKPADSLFKTNKKQWEEQMAEYKTALAFPTDNEPSGSQLFTFTRNPAA